MYGLLTEPGEKSTIFTIFGSYKENGHSWLILQVNTSDVLGERPALAVNAVTKPHPLSPRDLFNRNEEEKKSLLKALPMNVL